MSVLDDLLGASGQPPAVDVAAVQIPGVTTAPSVSDTPQAPPAIQTNGTADGSYRDEKTGRHYIVCNGVRYDPRQLKPEDNSEIFDHLTSVQYGAVEALAQANAEIEKAPPAIQKMLIDRAWAEIKLKTKKPTDDQARAYYSTEDGAAFLFQLSVLHQHPRLTLAQARVIIRKVNLAEALKLIDAVNADFVKKGEEAKRLLEQRTGV